MTNTITSWSAFRDVRNEIKTLMSRARRAFLCRAPSSKRPKEVRNIFNLSPELIHPDSNVLNRYFASTAKRRLGAKPSDIHDLFNLVNSFPVQDCPRFNLKNVTRDEICQTNSGA